MIRRLRGELAGPDCLRSRAGRPRAALAGLRIDSGNWELPRGRVELAPLILLSCCLDRVAPGFFGVAE